MRLIIVYVDIPYSLLYKLLHATASKIFSYLKIFSCLKRKGTKYVVGARTEIQVELYISAEAGAEVADRSGIVSRCNNILFDILYKFHIGIFSYLIIFVFRHFASYLDEIFLLDKYIFNSGSGSISLYIYMPGAEAPERGGIVCMGLYVLIWFRYI